MKDNKTATKNPVMVEAGKKAHRTRKINALLQSYALETSPGKKAAIKRKINAIKNS
jgi:hypothetical protein